MPDLASIGQEARDAHARRRHPGLRAATRVVGPMRVGAAEPEAERLPVRALGHEVVEGLELRPCRIAVASGGRGLSGARSLPGVPDRIAGLLEQVWIHGEPLRERPPEIAALVEPVDGLARQQCRARR